MAEIKERFHNLDFLKGLCVLFVIITHFSWKDEQRLYFLFPFWVDMAVPIFMILSGYVHSLSYKKHEINTLSDAYDLKNTINKIIRYTIPFLIIYIVEVTLASIEQGYLDEPLKLFYFFLQGTRGPGSYYYPILLQFVFLFPLIYFIIKRLDFKGLILCAAINFSYEILKNAYNIDEDCYRLIIFRYIFVIAFGCYLAIGKKQIKKPVYLTCFGIGVAYIIVYKFIEITPIFTKYWTGTSFLACMYVLPIAAFLISRKGIRFKPLEIIGKASYNIYFVQMVYYEFFSDSVDKSFGYLNQFLLMFITILVCVTIGIVFYYLETPLTKLIISKTNQRFNTKPKLSR